MASNQVPPQNQDIRTVNYLSVENVSKRYGERLLFEGVSFGILKGQKVALVAKNGTGKSTLFRILMGEETSDSGTVSFNGSIRTSFLAQDHGLEEELTILENLFTGDGPIQSAIRTYESAMQSGDGNALQSATDRMDQLQAWDHEAKARQILGKLNIHDLQRIVDTLSGGQKRRIALAKVLLEEPDLLLLDEPTNHLDLDMIEWLETYLGSIGASILMITHDRYFLEVICDEILEMDDEQLYRYKGNFSYYLEKKGEREANEHAQRDRARSLMRRELVWVRSTPKARTTKSKYRQDQFTVLKKEANKRLEEDGLELEISIQRLGGKIVEMHKVRKRLGDVQMLDGFQYVFKKGERMGVAGKNGTGKTTFLNLITEAIAPDGGKVVVGDTVRFGYYTQSGLKFKPKQRVIEVIREIADIIPLVNGKKITAEQMLERFLFPRKRHYEVIEKLSGGEQKRLHLLTVLMTNPNFLILDEPTNDLDIFALATLEDYLMQFTGVLVVVSHDRYFMDKLVDHMLVLHGNGEVNDILGNYTDWREQQKLAKSQKNAQPSKNKESNKPKREKEEKAKIKLTFKEKFEFDTLEKEIPKLEAKKIELEGVLASGIDDHEKLMSVSAELGALINELDEKGMRWLELSEFA